MTIAGVTITGFDFLFAGLLVFGVFRGRKRGMSEELLDVFQWLTIVVVCALVYDPLGRTISRTTGLALFYGYVIAYGFSAVLIKLGFAAVKRAVGEKLVHADTFGNFEYYLGMLAGALRYICIAVFCLSFLNAKYISDAERAATAQMQRENFGSISFPTIGSMQQTIFVESWSGRFIAKHVEDQLMRPASGTAKRGETIARRRERTVEEAMK